MPCQALHPAACDRPVPARHRPIWHEMLGSASTHCPDSYQIRSTPVIAPAATPARPAAHRSQCPTRSSAGPAPTWHAPPTGASCPLLPPGRPPCRTSSAGRHRSSARPHRHPGGVATPARPKGKVRPGSRGRSRCRAHLRPAWAVLQGVATPRWVEQGVGQACAKGGVRCGHSAARSPAHCAAREPDHCTHRDRTARARRGHANAVCRRARPVPPAHAPKKNPCRYRSRG